MMNRPLWHRSLLIQHLILLLSGMRRQPLDAPQEIIIASKNAIPVGFGVPI